ncbi:MAG: anaerobic ribonucleoside-triphosphate reductase [Candidatus Altiarchaeota archaeon]
MKVQKSNKQLVSFNRNKIIQTCMSAGSTLKLASQIASEVKGEGYGGMTTDEIRMRVYIKLKKINPDMAEQYVYRSNMKVRTSATVVEPFLSSKIVDSLVNETFVDRSFAEAVAKEVEKELGRMRLNYVTAPLIREIVNVKLLEHGMESVRARYTRLGMPVYDVKKLLEEGSKDIAQYSPEAVHRVMSDQIAREYALINILPVDIADAHMSGQIHIHDISHFSLRPTTFSHDLRFFLRRGLTVDGSGEYTATAGPAKHPQSAFMHALKVMVAGQTECSREQYIEDFNVLLAPYVVGLGYNEVKQLVQTLFYEVSQTSVGKGGQAIYAALVCDTSVPKYLTDMDAVQPGGKVQKGVCYSDYSGEAQMILDAMLDVSLDGDFLRKPFIYPKLLLNVIRMPSDGMMQKISDLSISFGAPYFLNTGKHMHGHRRGSIQHVTINLPQVSYKKGGNLFETLDNRMKNAFEVLLLKKTVMEKNLERNLLPFLKQKAAGLRYYSPEKQGYTISYSGLNELALLETGYDLRSKSGARFGKKVLKSMMKTVEGFRRESDLDFILSGTPKGICYATFAALDAARFGDRAKVNGGGSPYYSKTHYVNGKNLSEKLRIEGRFNRILNGRTLTHIRLSERVQDDGDLSGLIWKLLERKDVGYFTFSRALTVCGRCGHVQTTIAGKCGKCRSRQVSVWSRDTGHLQNIRTWSPARRQAFVDEYRYDAKGRGLRLSAKQANLIKNYG